MTEPAFDSNSEAIEAWNTMLFDKRLYCPGMRPCFADLSRRKP